jgi:hypothetical protein
VIASDAKGYVDEVASPTEFVQAIRIVNQGLVWAPRALRVHRALQFHF